MAPMNDEDWEQYEATINQIAQRIARRLKMTPATQREFLESIQYKLVTVWDRFDPQMGEFGGWCWQVLRNHGVSVIRTNGRPPGNNMFDGDGGDLEADPRENHEDRIATQELANNAVDALERCVSGLDRVLVAIDSQLLGRLTPERADRWVNEANLPAEFSWRDIEAIPDKAERRRTLAAALDRDVNWVRQRINRALGRIRCGLGNPP